MARKIMWCLLAMLANVIYVQQSYAEPITFTFEGTVTNNVIGLPPFPSIHVGDPLTGQFTIDILALSPFCVSGDRCYDLPRPTPLVQFSLPGWDVVGMAGGCPAVRFDPDTDRVHFCGFYQFSTSLGKSGLGSGYLSIDFRFPGGTIPATGPDTMPNWTTATSIFLNWTSPIGGVGADISPTSVTPIPEPTTLVLTASGLSGLVVLLVLRRKDA
jgi:hypothetical protein